MKLTKIATLFLAGLLAFSLIGAEVLAKSHQGNAAQRVVKQASKQTASKPKKAVRKTVKSAKRVKSVKAAKTVVSKERASDGQTTEYIGQASYYGGRFHGRRTASGERFDKNALTAAHRTLPFGSYVRVTHLGNGRSVVVRITDRGPYAHGRIIDLSEAAAAKLNILRAGVGRVKIERVSTAMAKSTPDQAVSLAEKSAPTRKKLDKKRLTIADKKGVKTAEKTRAEKKANHKSSKWGLSVSVNSLKEAKKLAAKVKQKVVVSGKGRHYHVEIASRSEKEQQKMKRQLTKLGYRSVLVK